MGTVSDEDMRAMRDAGCSEVEIARIVRLCECDRANDAVFELRRHRAQLMEELHEQQAKVDCVDFLVRKMKKSL